MAQESSIGKCMVNLFHQAGGTCWMDSIMTSLFLADHVRDKVWPHFFVFDIINKPLHYPIAVHPNLTVTPSKTGARYGDVDILALHSSGTCSKTTARMAETAMYIIQEAMGRSSSGRSARVRQCDRSRLFTAGGDDGGVTIYELDDINACIGGAIHYIRFDRKRTRLTYKHAEPGIVASIIGITFHEKGQEPTAHSVSMFECEGETIFFDNENTDADGSGSASDISAGMKQHMLFAPSWEVLEENIGKFYDQIYPKSQGITVTVDDIILIYGVDPAPECYMPEKSVGVLLDIGSAKAEYVANVLELQLFIKKWRQATGQRQQRQSTAHEKEIVGLTEAVTGSYAELHSLVANPVVPSCVRVDNIHELLLQGYADELKLYKRHIALS